MTQDLSKLKEQLQGVRTAMLATRTKDGLLHSRPMYVQDLDESGHIWFLGQERPGNAQNVMVDSNVNVSLCDAEKGVFVSIAGTAVTSENKKDIEEHTSKIDEDWFPKDRKDRTLVAIRVQIQEAEAWDSEEHRMVQIFGLSEALSQPQSYEKSGDRQSLQ